jgi:anhydro-N-acetylmuramic acid kinase
MTTTLIPELIPVIGLMSGTSIDAVDAALIMTDGQSFTRTGITANLPWPDHIRAAIFAVVDDPSRLENRDDISALEHDIAQHHALAVAAIHDQMKSPAALIGFHGQTVLHKPEQGYSVQLGSGETLAHITGCPVIYQFRQNDLHHGGQGAPLAPVYHAALLKQMQISAPAAIVNIGGIANITAITDTQMISMDTGPGNAMMDRMMQTYRQQPFDHDGQTAAAGQCDGDYVNTVLAHDWFHLPPPKSLDRVITEQMLSSGQLDTWLNTMPLADAMASLAEITARSIYMSCLHLPQLPEQMILAGGGARNRYLVDRISHHMNSTANIDVHIMDDYHINGDFIEAELMAFLAARSQNGYPISFPDTTGVDIPRSGGVRIDPVNPV